MTQDTHDRVWRPTRRVLVSCLALSAGLAAIAINALLAPGALSQRLPALFILAVAAAPLLLARSKVVLAADSVVVRNVFVVHHVLLNQISCISNYSRGSVHIVTVSGQTIQVYAVNTPMLAVMSGRRSRANDFMEAVEDAALSRGAPIDRGHLRRAIGASARAGRGAQAPPIAKPAAPGDQPATPHRGGEAHRRHGRTGEGPFPRRKFRPGYRRSEVDELIARIGATLDQDQSPARPVTAAEVRQTTFGVTRWDGYDDRAVDEALDRYAKDLDNLTR
jgi:DivIVA domain-containing protein